MFITTSRKPSRKTRTFAKVLANFLNLKYMPRGKTGLAEFPAERMIIIGEKGGNPFSMKIIAKDELINLQFNVSNIQKVEIDRSPVIFIGRPPFDPALIGGVSEDVKVNFETEKKVLVKKIDSHIVLDFRFGEKSLFKLKLLEIEGV